MTSAINNAGMVEAGAPMRSRALRVGFTLLEIILVLSLLLLVGALSLPYLEGWFEHYRLQQGADALRTRWVEARTLAMNEGRSYRFGWLSANAFRIAPDEPDYWPEQAGNTATVPFSGNGYSPGTLTEEALLPGVQFLAWQNGQTTAADGWSAKTIIFRPDGTARIYSADAAEPTEIVLVLADQRGRAHRLHLRGLTGVVTSLTGGMRP